MKQWALQNHLLSLAERSFRLDCTVALICRFIPVMTHLPKWDFNYLFATLLH